MELLELKAKEKDLEVQNSKLTGTYWSTYADVPRKEFHSFQWRMGVASLPAIPRSVASELYSEEFEDAASRTPSTIIPFAMRKDVLGGNAGQIAHILPHSLTCARVWTAVLRTFSKTSLRECHYRDWYMASRDFQRIACGMCIGISSVCGVRAHFLTVNVLFVSCLV